MIHRSLPAAALAAVCLAGISSAQTTDPDVGLAPNTQSLTAADVRAIISAAAGAVNDPAMVIAVSDRQGNILGIFSKLQAPALSTANFSQQVDTNDLAAALARTAAFFANSQAPLSSRTVRSISSIHFPQGVMYTSNGPLYGIENTNRGCPYNFSYAPGQAFPFARIAGVAHIAGGRIRTRGVEIPAATLLAGNQPGLGIITGKKDLLDSDPDAVNPGGVPLYKNGRMVGGVGVAGVSPAEAEYAAFIGSYGAGFLPLPFGYPGEVVLGGVALPFVNQTTQPPGTQPVAGGANLDDNALAALGQFVIAPVSSPGPAPEGILVTPRFGPLGGLSAQDVQTIINQAIAVANQTRAAIRLPIGTRAKFVISIADLDGQIIGLYRMEDSTIFSIDVSIAKSRNVIYFSGSNRLASDLPGVPMGTAITNRTIGYGAQPLYPPGIDFTNPGPFFSLYKFDALNPCTQGAQASNPYQNGIVFFPGSLPLYRNGVLVGGLGVSGDGVDQDDFVTSGGAAGFEAPAGIQADQIVDDGVRLPYLKFPRNPTD